MYSELKETFALKTCPMNNCIFASTFISLSVYRVQHFLTHMFVQTIKLVLPFVVKLLAPLKRKFHWGGLRVETVRSVRVYERLFLYPVS